MTIRYPKNLFFGPIKGKEIVRQIVDSICRQIYVHIMGIS